MPFTRTYTVQPRYQKTNPLSGSPAAGSNQIITDWMEEAIVVDVVHNEEHPAHSADGYNIGAIKFRGLRNQLKRAEENLHWAYPLDANEEDYPFKNEIVLVFESLNRFYYSRKVNIGGNANNQAFQGIESETGPLPARMAKAQNLQAGSNTPANQTASQMPENLGVYFQSNPNIYHLRHWEGDKIIEGRSGHSIRFGTSWKDANVHKGQFQALTTDQSPTLLLRVGQSPHASATPPTLVTGRIVEDINNDLSSIWMASDLVVPLKLATQGTPYNGRSVVNFPSSFSGNQIIINSSRVVINAKNDKVLLHAFDGIHLSTLKDGTWDAERDFIVRTGRQASLIAPKIYVGSYNSTAERMVLGDTLIRALTEFINAHITNASTYTITPVGPGTMSPAVLTAWQTLLNKLQTFLSQDNYVSKTNQRG